MKTRTVVAASAVLIVLAAWAASYAYGAARNFASQGRMIPYAVRFREAEGRGLLVRAWVNGTGPYSFAVDTGAGATIISTRVAQDARVGIRRGSSVNISGLSGAGAGAGREGLVRELAIGEADNLLPSGRTVIVTDGLPGDLDGVLDPVDAFWPLGFVIDPARGEISAFDPRTNPLRVSAAPPGGAVVPWIFSGGSRRPFVMLDGGRRALIDTGSGFGLALSPDAARAMGMLSNNGRARDVVRDLGGGSVTSRRIAPATVYIGALELRSVPTDLLSGVAAGAPILLGREALAPFRLSFDPQHKLIELSPQ
ncbi:MAG: aspartyl protease family protein [Acidobacteria bacterium]|nr:aspartyl protease family protein [Acidobacteriota bacterium]